MRPKPPTKFDLTPESYHEHNRYFNEAERLFDQIMDFLKCAPVPPEEALNIIMDMLVGVKR